MRHSDSLIFRDSDSDIPYILTKSRIYGLFLPGFMSEFAFGYIRISKHIFHVYTMYTRMKFQNNLIHISIWYIICIRRVFVPVFVVNKEA